MWGLILFSTLALVQSFTCFGIQSTSPTVCSGHGTCTSQDVCACQPEYYSSNCSSKIIVVPPAPGQYGPLGCGYPTFVVYCRLTMTTGTVYPEERFFVYTDSTPTNIGVGKWGGAVVDANWWAASILRLWLMPFKDTEPNYHGALDFNCVADSRFTEGYECRPYWDGWGYGCWLLGGSLYGPLLQSAAVATYPYPSNPSISRYAIGVFETGIEGTRCVETGLKGVGTCTKLHVCKHQCSTFETSTVSGVISGGCPAGQFCYTDETLGNSCLTDYTCSGTQRHVSSVCSGRGDCIGTDLCRCQQGYNGSICQTEITCFGIPALNTLSACSGHGTCTAPDTCSCVTDYTGAQCESRVTCFGIDTANPSVCNGHGSCPATDSCSCHAGYGGIDCSLWTCGGLLPNATGVCDGHGACVGIDSCQCYRYDWNSSMVCGGHGGVCSGNGTCICPVGSFGSDCADGVLSLPVRTEFTNVEPFGCGAIELTVSCCSVDGSPSSCTDYFSYMATPAWRIEDLSTPFSALFGVWIRPYDAITHNVRDFDCTYGSGDRLHCVAHTTAAGYGCLWLNPTSPYLFDVSFSSALFEGSRCTQNDSRPTGICDSGGICRHNCGMMTVNEFYGGGCPTGWFCHTDGIGYTAWNTSCRENHICYGIERASRSVCGGHGDCIATDTCICEDAYNSTIDCSGWSCFGVDKNSNETCSGYGECVAIDTCRRCQQGHAGRNCDGFLCFGTSWISDEVCAPPGNLSRGNCTGIDQCECNSGYFGARCEFYGCWNRTTTDPNVCNAHGTCTPPNCVCSDGYSGNTCEIIRTCGNITFNSSNVCGGHGSCTAEDTCSCSSGYSEANCDVWSCGGNIANSEEVCSAHGNCSAPNSCQCDSGYTNSVCGTWSCGGIERSLAETCSGRGNCTGPNSCSCRTGYYGANCADWDCGGFHKSSSAGCGGRGLCVAPESCTCGGSYIGNLCQNDAAPVSVGLLVAGIAAGLTGIGLVAIAITCVVSTLSTQTAKNLIRGGKRKLI